MLPYGVPRIRDAEWPDKLDIKRFGFSTADRCSRRDRGKQEARRVWKKLARRQTKELLHREFIAYVMETTTD